MLIALSHVFSCICSVVEMSTLLNNEEEKSRGSLDRLAPVQNAGKLGLRMR